MPLQVSNATTKIGDMDPTCSPIKQGLVEAFAYDAYFVEFVGETTKFNSNYIVCTCLNWK